MIESTATTPTVTPSTTPATLGALFAANAEAFSRQPLPADALEAVREDVGAADRMLLEGFVTGDLLAALYQALDLPLEEILRSAWGSLVELQEYRDTKRHPPEETSSVRFGKHRVTSTHHPKVELLLNERRIAALTFDLQLTLNIAATTLLVRAGHIWQARGCELQGEAALSYRGFSLLKKKSGTIALPAAIDFEGGIPIPSLPKAVG